MSDPPPRTPHRIVVVRQDNGELVEDVRALTDEKDAPAAASDADTEKADRVTHAFSLPEGVERQHPADPVPGTIPRDEEEPGRGP